MKIVLIVISCLFVTHAIAQSEVPSGSYRWADAVVKKGADRESRKILEGTSTHLKHFRIHATTQFKGAKPSNLHANDSTEECLIIKEGMVRATVEGRSVILGPGGVIMLMPKQMHSLENIGDGNLTYYVVGLRSIKKMDLARGQAAGGTLMLNRDSLKFTLGATGGKRSYFDRATAMCERFEMHITQLDKKGPSHAPHKHNETEIILIISGDTEMTIDGKEFTASAGDLYVMNSETLHGVRNAKDTPCSYFAFKWK